MSWLIGVVLLLIMLWASLRFLPAGAEGHMPLPYMIALTHFLWIPSVVCVILAVLDTNWLLLVLSALALLGVLSFGIPYYRHARFLRHILPSQLKSDGWSGIGNGHQRPCDTTDYEVSHKASTFPDILQTTAQNPSHETSYGEFRETIRETIRETLNYNNTANSLRHDSGLDAEGMIRETQRETSQNAGILPVNHSSHPAAEHTGAPIIRVMTLNCRYGHADADAIVTAVQSRHIAVLALQELSESLVHRLEASGLNRLLPYQQLGTVRDTDNGGFNGIWTSLPVENSSVSSVEIPAADVPSLSIVVPASAVAPQSSPDSLQTDDGSTSQGSITSDPFNHKAHEVFGTAKRQNTITFASAHTKSPMRGCRQWSQGIRTLRNIHNSGSQRESDSRNDMTVVMGDLNANLHHPSFRELLRSGFQDASLEQGTGPVLTFPSKIHWPRLELDHILFTQGITVSGLESFVVPDTDHLALTASLHLTQQSKPDSQDGQEPSWASS